MTLSCTNAGKLVNKITLDLDKIRFFFEQAFLAEQNEIVNCAIFKSLWQILSGVEGFESIQELEAFYTNIEIQLPHYLEDFCAQFNDESQEKISAKLINLLAQIVRVYHLLIKQQFYAQRFVEHNSVFDDQVASLKKESLSVTEVINTLNQNEIENFIQSYVQALLKLVDRLNKGYGEIEVSFENVNDVTQMEAHEILTKINKEITLIPDTIKLNEEIDKLKEAFMADNHHSINFYQIKLKNYIKLIAEIKERIDALLSQASQQLNGYLSQLSKQTQVLNERIAKIDEQYQEIRKIFFSALTIQGYSENDLVVSQGYEALFEAGDKLNVLCKIQENDWFTMTMGKSVKTKTWERTGEQVKTLVHGIATDLEKLVSPYVKSMLDIEQLHEQTQLNARAVESLNGLRSYMEKLKMKSEKIIPVVRNIFKNIGHTLTEHIENTINFFKLFGTKHWKEVTTATLGGAGVGVLLGLLATSPLSLAFFIPTGIVIGFSTGSSIGLARDHFFAKKTIVTQSVIPNVNPENNPKSFKLA